MGSVETIAAWAAIAISQALAGSQSVPGTADDLGGPPTAPTLASRATQVNPDSVTVPVLFMVSGAGVGFAVGRGTRKEGNER